MSLNKQIFVYAFNTDAFYSESEQNQHNRLLKLYGLRKKIKNRRDNPKSAEVYYKDENWKYSCVNRIVAKEKEKMTQLLNERLNDSTPRELNPESLKDKNIISLFESSLTRALGVKTNELTKAIVVVNVFFFQVFESIVKNGFMYNGDKYVFLTSSAGQIRQKKGVFIKESEYLKIQMKMTCGLSIDKINKMGGINVNKFCAYLALGNSATDEWEGFNIRKAIVVEDFETCFPSEVDHIDYISYEIKREIMPVNIPCTDGWGLVDGETTRQVRAPWIKGLLTNFRFKDYLRENCTPDQWVVKDIYGKEHNVVEEDIKYIFCKSQFKLYKFYSSWDEYCYNFEKYGCTVNYCNLEEEAVSNTRINYQMLQQLVNVTDKEIETLVKKSVEDINNIGQDYQTTMRLLGATKSNKNPSWFQEALQLYPELIKDPYCREILKATKKSLVKQAKGGKIRINGKYLFVAPNPLAFCDYLFKGIKAPKESLAPNEVYTNQFDDGAELALLRSPSLGKEWGIRINKRNPELDKWLGDTNCIYTSSYDTISKLLSFD